MIMTLQKFGGAGLSSTVSALILSTGILVLVAMMVLPLPTFLLDTFFVSNILLSILVLMVALHAYRPLDFSSFPSLLLIATVLRLGLNVASTRIILGKGQDGPEAAGQVINAFGQFVIAERRKKMKHLLKTVIRNVKSVKGNSLAEFATTTALMATLAATAAPKLSEMSEGAKGEKSRNEIDKIIKQAGQFYQDTADQEGRGRFPNQKKFDVAIGGGSQLNYDNGSGQDNNVGNDHIASDAHEAAILSDLGITTATPSGGWDRFDEAHLNQWQSVFDASYSKSQQADGNGDDRGGVLAATNYNVSADGVDGISNEWDALFGDEVLESKFQDGHYVYSVVAGGGTGNDVYPPTIYVADVESAVDFNNVLMP